jgi:PKD repeat protein
VSPKKPRAGRKVRFRGKLAGAAGTSFSWSFGDHKKGKGATVKHAYRKAGKYRVTLKVATATGVAFPVTKTVKVRR